MANYGWDLGFDFNAEQDDGTFYLQNGFVAVGVTLGNGPDGTGGTTQTFNVPATPVNLQKNDTISFNVFNVTSPLPSDSSYSIENGSLIVFKSANSRSPLSPFSTASIPLNLLAPVGTGPSIIFSGLQASQPHLVSPATFPSYGGPTALQVVNDGSFLMTVILIVKETVKSGPTTTRIFKVDPEMIIGSAG